MPLINAVVESLTEVEASPVDLVITDGDDTVFPKGESEPYAEAATLFENLRPQQLFLVSDDPNKALACRRADAIGADGYQIPERFPHWIKYQHFKAVIARATQQEGIHTALVLGNRWLMDVGMARIALARAGVASTGYLVHRPDAYQESFDRYIIDPVQYAGALMIKRVGADQHFRPRRP